MIDAVPTFEEFARCRAPHLFRSAWLLTGGREEAEDLVQETLAKVFVRMHRRLGPRLENPAAYAQVVLTRTFVSNRRRRSSTEVPYADLPEPVAGDHAELSGVRDCTSPTSPRSSRAGRHAGAVPCAAAASVRHPSPSLPRRPSAAAGSSSAAER